MRIGGLEKVGFPEQTKVKLLFEVRIECGQAEPADHSQKRGPVWSDKPSDGGTSFFSVCP